MAQAASSFPLVPWTQLQDPDLLAVVTMAAARAEEYLAGTSLEEYLANPTLQDAISGCLLVMGQAAREVTETSSHLPWLQLEELGDWRLYGYRDEAGARNVWAFLQTWLPRLAPRCCLALTSGECHELCLTEQVTGKLPDTESGHA